MNVEPGERQRFGRYETLFRIAAGGMAEVYAARALGEGGFQKLVALKRMRPELAEDARFVTMFLDEGRVAANIASPHVVSTLDLGRAEDNSLYLVMELVTGAPLSGLMAEAAARNERIPIPLAVDILAQAASGLHSAHIARSPTGEPLEIVHRDCSPHNILVDIHGQVKITDFGIAKALERQTRSHAGEIKGKLQYFSPEQARGQPLDRRVDIFILGVVAWEVLAGRQLFEAENPVEALHKVATMPIRRLDEIVPGLSPKIAVAVAQALAREPDERFATAEAFGNALRHALDGPTPPASEVGALVRRYGGESLHTVERRVREVLSAASPATPPSSSMPPRPPPRVDDARSRAQTLRSHPPPTGPPSGPASIPAPISAPAAPPATQRQAPVAASTPRPPWAVPSSPPRARVETEPIPLVPSAASTPPPRSKTSSPSSRPSLKTARLPESGAPGPHAATSREFPHAGAWPGAGAPTSVPPRPARKTSLWIVGFGLLVLLAGGGGAIAAWWSSQRVAPSFPAASPTEQVRRPERLEPGTPVGSSERPPGPSERSEDALTQHTLPRREDPSPRDPVRSPTPEPPVARRRPAARPRVPERPASSATPRATPHTVSGTNTAPRGDRETAFSEIPWE